MEKKVVLRNVIFALLLQITTMLSGFIIPKIILNQFGSDVNGLVSSINQFLNYIQLVEGGLSGVLMSALYKPLSDGDMSRVSGIVKAASDFFRKIGLIYVVYMLVLAFVYPLFVDTGYSYEYSLMLVLVLGMNLFVQYFFSITFKLLINADRKVYFVSLTQIIIVIINTLATIACAAMFKDILVIKFASALIFFIQPILFSTYVKKHYQLDKQIEPDEKALSQRWNGFGVNLAYFVHTNTDIVILTVLSTLANVSIYSVYHMIAVALKNLVGSISQAIVPSFGKVLAENDKTKLHSFFDKYEFVIYFVSTIMFTCGIILITPFVDVYTKGIADADYHQTTFGIILALAEMVYCIRDPYISVSYAAGHFKQIAKYAYTEAILNIILSLILVVKFNILGIAIGTLISMIYRMIVHIYYIKKNIMFRSYGKAIRIAVIFMTTTFLCYFTLTSLFDLNFGGYVSFFIYGVIIFAIVSIFNLMVSLLFYRNQVKSLLKRNIS